MEDKQGLDGFEELMEELGQKEFQRLMDRFLDWEDKSHSISY